jgi:hypothetical protein
MPGQGICSSPLREMRNKQLDGSEASAARIDGSGLHGFRDSSRRKQFSALPQSSGRANVAFCFI